MEKAHYLNVSEMIDAIILAETARAQKSSVVGKIIIPMDNSYATSVETGCEARVYGKKFVCLSEPYIKEIKPFYNGDIVHKKEMVKVRSVETGRVYEIMFAEEYLVSKK